MNELLEVAKEFLGEEVDLKNKIIKDLTYNIINSPKFYVKIGSEWYVSLTTKTSELYMFREFTYQSKGGYSVANYFINSDGIIISPREEVMPWEDFSMNFHDFIYNMDYNEIEKTELDYELIEKYVDVVERFIAYCKTNASSYSDFINFKDYIYLAYTIIEDFKGENYE